MAFFAICGVHININWQCKKIISSSYPMQSGEHKLQIRINIVHLGKYIVSEPVVS